MSASLVRERLLAFTILVQTTVSVRKTEGASRLSENRKKKFLKKAFFHIEIKTVLFLRDCCIYYLFKQAQILVHCVETASNQLLTHPKKERVGGPESPSRAVFFFVFLWTVY